MHTGSCLCGAVQITAEGDPDWVGHCHCRSCQRAVGGAFATYAGYEKAKVSLAGDALKRFASSPGVVRSFCAKCGSPLSFEGDNWPGEIHLFAVMLDDATDLKPEVHVQLADKMPWLHLDDDLPKFNKFTKVIGDG